MSKTNSIGLTKENHELLKKAAAQRGTSMYSLVNVLLKDLDLVDKSEKVILSVPSSLTKKNKDALQEWLELRVAAIVAAYYPQQHDKGNDYAIVFAPGRG